MNNVDVLGLRELTPEERSFVQRLEALKARASGDEEFVKAMNSVIADYQDRIATIRDNVPDPRRIGYINNAFRIWASDRASSFHPQGRLDEDYGSGTNKCNKYVSEVLEGSATLNAEGGWGTYLTNDFSAYVQRSPIAGEWANPALLRRFTPKYRITRGMLHGEVEAFGPDLSGEHVLTFEAPVIGDIVSFGEPTQVGSDAHVGIYLGGTPIAPFYISATGSGEHGQRGVVIKFGPDRREKLYRSP